MTLALGRTANLTMPTYRTGCKPGHTPLRFRGDDGACFRCGRQPPPGDQLDSELLVREGRRKVPGTQLGGWQLLEEAIAQERLKLLALALLENVDIEDVDELEQWAAADLERTATVDNLLGRYPEAEVRWAIKAAYT